MAETLRCPQCGAELPAGTPEQPCPACLMKLGLESWAGQRSDANLGPTQISPPGSFEAPQPEELADQFPQLEILELLGHGGMGAVYKARQKSLDRLVALKIIKPDAADDPGFAERFSREAKALAKLSHPNIVTVHDFGQVGSVDGSARVSDPAERADRRSPAVDETSGQSSASVGDRPQQRLYYFIMEYIDGVNLRQAMEAGRLEPEQALKIVPSICDALQYAHDEGVVHRDIKPENILLDQKGRVKIADFGLAKLIASGGHESADVTLTGTHQVMGTPRYMAPEQMLGSASVDHRADIYSLGVVFYELLTGEVPLGRFEPPSSKVQIDVRLDEVVLRALAREPEKRYQRASDVKTDVETISGYIARGPIRRIANLDDVASELKIPAIGLLIAGVLEFAVGAVSAVVFALSSHPPGQVELFLVTGPSLLFGGLAIATSIRLRRLRNYRAAMYGTILCALPLSYGWFFRIAFAVLALMSLRRPDVRAAFGSAHNLEGFGDSAAGQSGAVSESGAETHASLQRQTQGINQQLQGPASGLFVTGVLNWIGLPVTVILLLMNPHWLRGDRAPIDTPAGDAMLAVLGIGGLIVSGLIMFAALKMKRLEGYRLAVVGSVLAMIVTPGNIVGLPVGVWALAVLSSREVRNAFAAQREALHRRNVLDDDERGQLESNIVASLKDNRPVQAVRQYRDTTGAGVADAKQAVEDIAQRHGIEIKGLTPQQRVWQIAITTAVVAVLCAGFAKLASIGVSPLVTGTALAVTLTLYVLFLIAMWVGVRRDCPRSKNPDAPAQSPHPFTPGSGPRLLALGLGFVITALVAVMGAGFIAYGLVTYDPGKGDWIAWLAGGYGGFIGGLGGFFGCWNNYRKYRGAGDLMHDPAWNWLDSSMVVYCFAGVLATLVGIAFWPSLNVGVRITTLVLGSFAALHGAGVSVWRLGLRRSVQRETVRGQLDLRLMVIAAGMVLASLMIAAGVAVVVLAFINLQIGSAGFWGWIAAAFGFVMGGVGTLMGVWNAYRTMEGAEDLLSEGRRNFFDRYLWVVGGLGLVLLLTATIGSPWMNRTSVYAGCIGGGALLIHALSFWPIRALIRRAARHDETQDEAL